VLNNASIFLLNGPADEAEAAHAVQETNRPKLNNLLTFFENSMVFLLLIG
jgi:hypothetical protein